MLNLSSGRRRTDGLADFRSISRYIPTIIRSIILGDKGRKKGEHEGRIGWKSYYPCLFPPTPKDSGYQQTWLASRNRSILFSIIQGSFLFSLELSVPRTLIFIRSTYSRIWGVRLGMQLDHGEFKGCFVYDQFLSHALLVREEEDNFYNFLFS